MDSVELRLFWEARRRQINWCSYNFAARRCRCAGIDPVGDNVVTGVIDSVRAATAVLLEGAVAWFKSRGAACYCEARRHRLGRCRDKFAIAVLISVVTSIPSVTILPLGGAVASIQYVL